MDYGEEIRVESSRGRSGDVEGERTGRRDRR